MARLIDADALLAIGHETKLIEIFPNWKELPYETQKAVCKYGAYVKQLLQKQPTVDADINVLTKKIAKLEKSNRNWRRKYQRLKATRKADGEGRTDD